MNKGRIVLGGLVAGVVLNILEYIVHGVLLAGEWDAAMVDLGKEPLAGPAITWMILLTFVLGIVLVKMYAIFRPRFGPGPKTAIYAGLMAWVLYALFPWLWNSISEIFPSGLMTTSTMYALFELPIATIVGAWFYKEEEPGAAAAPSSGGESAPMV